jgi:hypothetical protein
VASPHVLKLAFKHTLRKLNLVDRNDPICDIVARKVIEIEATGATDAIAIPEMVVRQLGPYQGRQTQSGCCTSSGQANSRHISRLGQRRDFRRLWPV